MVFLFQLIGIFPSQFYLIYQTNTEQYQDFLNLAIKMICLAFHFSLYSRDHNLIEGNLFIIILFVFLITFLGRQFIRIIGSNFQKVSQEGHTFFSWDHIFIPFQDHMVIYFIIEKPYRTRQGGLEERQEKRKTENLYLEKRSVICLISLERIEKQPHPKNLHTSAFPIFMIEILQKSFWKKKSRFSWFLVLFTISSSGPRLVFAKTFSLVITELRCLGLTQKIWVLGSEFEVADEDFRSSSCLDSCSGTTNVIRKVVILRFIS